MADIPNVIRMNLKSNRKRRSTQSAVYTLRVVMEARIVRACIASSAFVMLLLVDCPKLPGGLQLLAAVQLHTHITPHNIDINVQCNMRFAAIHPIIPNAHLFCPRCVIYHSILSPHWRRGMPATAVINIDIYFVDFASRVWDYTERTNTRQANEESEKKRHHRY